MVRSRFFNTYLYENSDSVRIITKRIAGIIKDLGIKTKNNLLLVNRRDKEIEKDKIKDLNLNYIGNIPDDEKICKISLSGDSLWKLEDNAISISALRKIGDKIWQAN